jgi:hypothetical protein
LKKTCITASYVIAFPFTIPNGSTIIGADIEFLKTIQIKLGFDFRLYSEPNLGRELTSNNTYVGMFASVSC